LLASSTPDSAIMQPLFLVITTLFYVPFSAAMPVVTRPGASTTFSLAPRGDPSTLSIRSDPVGYHRPQEKCRCGRATFEKTHCCKLNSSHAVCPTCMAEAVLDAVETCPYTDCPGLLNNSGRSRVATQVPTPPSSLPPTPPPSPSLG